MKQHCRAAFDLCRGPAGGRNESRRLFLAMVLALVVGLYRLCGLRPEFKKTLDFCKAQPSGFFWVLAGFIELWVYWFFPTDKWVVPSRNSLDRMHLALLTALLVVSFVSPHINHFVPLIQRPTELANVIDCDADSSGGPSVTVFSSP